MQLPVDTRGGAADAPTLNPRKTSVGTGTTHVWAPAGQIDVLLVNRDLTATMYVGGPEVDAGAGLPIPPLGSVTVPGDVNWYAVADTAGAQLWAMPGASSYTPSPAETAAQLALTPLPVKGAEASQTVASGATANVVVTANNGSNVPLTVTVIAGNPKTIELHEMQVPMSFGATPAGNTAGVRLIRSDTGADLMVPANLNGGGATTTVTQEADKDFNGVRIPPGVAVQLVLTCLGFGSVITASVDLNYSLIG